jgi:hypothetical protein
MSLDKVVEPAPAAKSYSDVREGLRAEALRDALEADGVIEKKVESQTTPVENKPKVEQKVEQSTDPFTKSFTKFTTEKEQFRKQTEAWKPYAEMSKHLTVDALSAAVKAKQAGDPMAILAAFGFSHTDYVRQTAAAAAGKPAPAKDASEKEEPQENSELAQLKAELAELRNERMQEKVQSQRTQVLTAMKDELARQVEKFPLINDMEAQGDVLRFIEQHVQRTGSPPGESFEETVAMAATEVESRLTQAKEKWSKVLTKQKTPVRVQGEAEEPLQAGSEEVVGKTLTNRMSATVAARPVSSDRASRIAEIAQDNSLWEG